MNGEEIPGAEVSAPMRVLLIEDDAVDEAALTAAVAERTWSCRMMVARSVAEARATLARHDFGLILADHSLPDGNAFDLADAFGAQPVILFIGPGDEEGVARGLKLGVHDYLIKDPQRGYLKLLPWRIEVAMRQARVARRLHESEARVALAVRGSTDGIWDSNLVTGEAFVSDSMVGNARLQARGNERLLRAVGGAHPSRRS